MKTLCIFAALGFMFGCSESLKVEDPKFPLVQIEADEWPPITFDQAIEIKPDQFVPNSAIIIRAAIFVEQLSDESGTFVFTPYWDDRHLTTAEVPLTYPEFDHVFLEWVIHVREVGEDGGALTYGTITVTDINQGSIIRGGWGELGIDTTSSHLVSVGIGRTAGPGSLRANLLSLTIAK